MTELLDMAAFVLQMIGLMTCVIGIHSWVERRRQSGTGPYILTLTVTAKVRQHIESLRVMSEKVSILEIIRSALGVYEHLWQRIADGDKIIIREANGSESELDLI